MRDRLIELIKTAEINEPPIHRKIVDFAEVKQLADHLLANGVIVPPCKVGDKVYFIYCHNGKKVGEATVEEIYRGDGGFAYHLCSDYTYFDVQEEEVYLTKEEAEQALKGGAE